MNWPHRELSEVTRITSGQSPPSKAYNNDGIGLEFHQGKKHFGKDTLEESGVWTTEETKKAVPGDIVMSVRAPVGPVNIVPREICIGRGLASLTALEGLNKRYLFLFLIMNESRIKGHSGTTFNSINKKEIGQITIPCPPLIEQNRIVEVLDEAFATLDKVKANIERNIENAEELFQSELNKVFKQFSLNDEEHLLGDVCDFVRGPFGGSLKKSCFVEKGYAVYEQKHPIHGDFSSFRYFIDQQKFEEMKRFQVKTGDVLMSCSGTIGRTKVVPEGAPVGIINQALLKLSVKPGLLPHFLQKWMESDSFLLQIAQRSGGAALQNVASVKILKTIKLHIPSLRQQQVAIKQLHLLAQRTEATLRTLNHQIESVDGLRQSILEQAFEGKLTGEVTQIAEA